MTSKPVAQLLVDLGVDRSHSRPHVSNDNPYSEAAFKTLKYCPAFPDNFGSLQDARAFCDPILQLLQQRALPLRHRARSPPPPSTTATPTPCKPPEPPLITACVDRTPRTIQPPPPTPRNARRRLDQRPLKQKPTSATNKSTTGLKTLDIFRMRRRRRLLQILRQTPRIERRHHIKRRRHRRRVTPLRERQPVRQHVVVERHVLRRAAIPVVLRQRRAARRVRSVGRGERPARRLIRAGPNLDVQAVIYESAAKRVIARPTSTAVNIILTARGSHQDLRDRTAAKLSQKFRLILLTSS